MVPATKRIKKNGEFMGGLFDNRGGTTVRVLRSRC